MVRFVDVSDLARWAAEGDLESILARLVAYQEEDYRRWPSFEVTPRVASHSCQGVIELMPTSDGASYCFKYVNGHPANPARGLQTVTAFGMLADVHNGYPTFISEMTALTALRTPVHVNAIGGDCPGKTELDPEILRRSDVFVEFTEQTPVDGTDYYDEIDLIADPVDPKDLFSLVRALAPVPVGS